VIAEAPPIPPETDPGKGPAAVMLLEPEGVGEAPQPEAMADSMPEIKPEARPEIKPEAQPEEKPEAKPEIKAETKPEAKLPAPQPEQAPPQIVTREILASLSWSVQEWADPGEVHLLAEPAPHLLVVTEKSVQGKLSIAAKLPSRSRDGHPVSISASANTDYAENQKQLSLACFVRLGEAKEYYESRAMPLGGKEKPLVFSLTEPVWKTEKSKWEFTEKIPRGQKIFELGFLLYDVSAGTTVFFTKIEIISEIEG
ncbi:MAG: hypothetical protein JXA52_09440, partial [Planctomycetes bacterium]|nr:hypothetical protein [Planctomycetota bacterium]